MKIIGLLLLILCMGETLFAQKVTTINGYVKHGRTRIVNLYDVVNGEVKVLKSTEADADGKFRFDFSPNASGFYTVGDDRRNYVVYVKGGEEIQIDLLEKQAQLAGKNTRENQALYQWENFINDIRCDAMDNPMCTYREFFPKLMAVVPKIDSVKKAIRSKNKAFDELLKKKIDYDLDYYAMLFILSPRSVHPERDEWPDFYKNVISDEKFTTIDVLKFPLGARMMSMYTSFATIIKAPRQGIEALNNDELKGEMLLFGLKYCKFHSQFDEKMKESGKYLVTEDQQNRAREIAMKLSPSLAGKPAMDFTYPDMNGKEISLSDFKGKVVVVDVWATWCGPCKRELPFLKKLEEEMHGKEVVFIAVSLDEAKDKQKWIDFVMREALKGVQLHASGWSQIAKDYEIKGIPRFMLIDRKGNIVSENAPRPSDPRLKEMIEAELKK